ncbi:MAG: DUF705 domain-containing protein [Planctomycetes bacterium]|nr:DUF705 domain-containing protein [Planctomycetota bacterium]
MKIVFDLDNTLVDEFGATVRPGIVRLLDRLLSERHELALWTHSDRARAIRILRDHGLRDRFGTLVCREDYDPDSLGARKDIRRIQGDLLVDDDPAEVAFARSVGRSGFRLASYRRGDPADLDELEALHQAIRRASRWWGRLFRGR